MNRTVSLRIVVVVAASVALAGTPESSFAQRGGHGGGGFHNGGFGRFHGSGFGGFRHDHFFGGFGYPWYGYGWNFGFGFSPYSDFYAYSPWWGAPYPYYYPYGYDPYDR